MGTPPNPGPIRRPATRLAPSPTGALHLGNARTFLVTWALARQRGMRVVLRIEDLDSPRVKAGVADLTIDLLAWLGLDWDEGPYVQSRDLEPYREAMRALARAGMVYPSPISRADAADVALSAPQEGARESVFPASLRPSALPRVFADDHENWRLATPPGPVRFDDEFAGAQEHTPSSSVGDFLVWSRRGVPAYQLGVVVDDHRQGVTHVIRGDDLLDSTARQLLLYRALHQAPEPAYLHLPLVRGEDGRRLAKRHGDTRLDAYRARGVTRERVVGLMAAWSGVLDRNAPRPMGAREFLDRFRVTTMPRGDVVFGPEDERWLTAR